ncbi:GrpB family protein [Bacillus swezeyi]|uniref:GrpB family protein n=1 Tax=Bacillus swezeyi TaxID=1925020 RepID=UPI002E1C31D4|nr:GrpB family protein [Bacillus swezeyi]
MKSFTKLKSFKSVISGSTSILGMSAKPIIDILLEVKDLGSVGRYEKVRLWKTAVREEVFFKEGAKSAHTILRDIRRHLLFQDYLMSIPNGRKNMQS